jgi:probable HAF family extracellular repeat protein
MQASLDPRSRSRDPLGLSTVANDINNLGQIVGSYSNLGGTYGFLLSGGTYITLDDPVAKPGTTQALGINDAGHIIGQYYDASNLSHAFLYSGGAYTTIDPPSALTATASGINDAGQIVGTYNDASLRSHGFLYSGGTYITHEQ